MRKQKKRMDQLKPINVVATAAIVATTLFTPIVDVLPGKYNIVHAAETQNPAKHSVINASNKWEGLYSTHFGISTRDYGNYLNYRGHNGELGIGAVLLRGHAQTEVEAKVRTDADQVHQFDQFGYNFSDRQWYFASQPFTPLTDAIPDPGEWAVWKLIYDKIAQKKTLYLNGKKIGEGDTPEGIFDHFFKARNVDVNNQPVSIDVEYVNVSYTAISNEKPVDPLSGMSATDKEDGDLIGKLKVTENTVDSKKPGSYKVKYEVTDKDGNT
ncbi:hypothetical protein IKE_05734, partial [Bacillus cereus VD196]